MKKKTLALSATLLLSFGSQAMAQINDVTFTASPTAGYTWWHKDLGLGDSPFWGVRAGFSFGPVLELRATYDKTFNLKQSLESSSLGFLNSLGANLDTYTATAERIGGELKVNLWSGTILAPYITAGAGVLNLDHNFTTTTNDGTATVAIQSEQLYGALGAGLKINLAKRIALALEAKNMLINVEGTDGKNKTLQNWGGQASLDFYLGGRERSKDAVSRAYRNMFTDGFRGIKFVLEPGIAYIDFNKNSIMHDQWLMGGSAGIDLSSIIGIRGFYYQATESPQKLNFKFNKDLKLYGGNLITRLNQPNGVTPYLILGGGYMDVTSDKYIDTNGTFGAKSGWFAMGGAGIEIPLHPYVALHGNVNAMLNEQENPKAGQVMTTSQVNLNVMYQAGVRFNLGVRNRNAEKLYKAYAYDERISEREANMKALNNLRSEYEARISNLNEQLAQAALQRDTVKIISLAEERAEVKETINKVEAKLAEEAKRPIEEVRKTVVMTPEQLEEIITRVTTKAKTEKSASASSMSDLDKILLYSALSNGQRISTTHQQAFPSLQSSLVTSDTEIAKSKEDALLNKIEQLESKINATHESVLRQRIEQTERDTQRMIEQQPTTKVQPTLLTEKVDKDSMQIIQYKDKTSEETKGEQSADVRVVTLSKEGVETKEYTLEPVKKSFLKFSDVQLFTGLGLGDDTSFNIGVRPEWQIGKSAFYLAPEAFLAFGSSTNFGISASALYKFGAIKNVVSPYAGLGLGYNSVAGLNRFGLNTIVGVTFNKLLGGKVFVDYTLRPEFKNHQIAVGYQLSF